MDDTFSTPQFDFPQTKTLSSFSCGRATLLVEPESIAEGVLVLACICIILEEIATESEVYVGIY